MATDDSFASRNRKSGYENVEKEGNNRFLELVRKNWVVVPSGRGSWEWKTTTSRVECAVEGRSAHGAKSPLAVRERQVEQEGGKRKGVGDDAISKARGSSEAAAFEKVEL